MYSNSTVRSHFTTKTRVLILVQNETRSVEVQKELPRVVKWGEVGTENAWMFEYLDSIMEAGGGHMTDV